MKSDDVISRQDAIDALKAMAVPLHLDSACEDIWERDRTLDNAIDVMRGLPSAQPLDAQMAYYMGLKDGVKECNERLEKFIDEMRRQE